jgi:uridine kinase
VAGPIGSGKSTLVRALVDDLQDASLLVFDHYENISQKNPVELVDWMRAGADIDLFTFHALARDLSKLRQGAHVVDPVTNELTEARKYIIFEMPFGKSHAETSRYIDLLLWIDLPLDVALARKIKEYTAIFVGPHSPYNHQEGLAWLHGYLENYLVFVHNILLIQQEKVRPLADLLLDGQSGLDAMKRESSMYIKAKFP